MPRNQGTSRKGKPKKNERAAGMGRALQKAQRGGQGGGGINRNKGSGMSVSGGLANPSTAILSSAMEQAENNLSMLQIDSVDDFLMQAEMAGREFESEKQQFVVLDNHGSAYQTGQRHVKWQDQTPEDRKIKFCFEELSVPRRPQWNETTTPEELDKLENEAFLEWRRAIAAKEEELFSGTTNLDHAYYSKTVTPYEKNLQVWRQLWRVLERCSCVVQLVDARNPMFYLSEDLRKYAEELGKPMMLLVNKGDYLSPEQRRLWSLYLHEKNWDHVFFSAYLEQTKLDKAAQSETERIENSKSSDDEDDLESDNDSENSINEDGQETRNDVVSEGAVEEEKNKNGVEKLLTREQLIHWMHDFAIKNGCTPNPRYENRIQFGTVGFPNVGKSSVINVLMGNSKHTHGLVRVGVAAQPGKTKHFQTLLLPARDDMMLCDCPGLVFPSFVSNTADLIAAGVYPIAQMRDHWPVVELICRRIPREIINASYGISIPEPSLQELNEKGLDKVPPPTAEEFLNTYCVARSMLAASSGVPDATRAARIVIKDYVSGKLLYCHPPPNAEHLNKFHLETVRTAITNTEKLRNKLLARQALNDNERIVQNGDDNPKTDVEDDFDSKLLEMLGDSAGGGEVESGKRGTKKRWGKKGKKLRDKDPYGCHADPDETLTKTPPSGVAINAGKYGRAGFTRNTHYAGARSALNAAATTS